MPILMTLPFSTNTLIIFLLCLGIFFSLPTQEFFRGQGKIKVGTGTEIKKRCVISYDTPSLFYMIFLI